MEVSLAGGAILYPGFAVESRIFHSKRLALPCQFSLGGIIWAIADEGQGAICEHFLEGGPGDRFRNSIWDWSRRPSRRLSVMSIQDAVQEVVREVV